MLPNRFLETGAARLFLPLNDHNDVDLECLLGPQHLASSGDSQHRTLQVEKARYLRSKRQESKGRTHLVVAHSPSVDPAVLPPHLKWIARPQLRRRRRNDIEMSINRNPLPSRRLEPIGSRRCVRSEGSEYDRVRLGTGGEEGSVGAERAEDAFEVESALAAFFAVRRVGDGAVGNELRKGVEHFACRRYQR
jgi:hypothetical protein